MNATPWMLSCEPLLPADGLPDCGAPWRPPLRRRLSFDRRCMLRRARTVQVAGMRSLRLRRLLRRNLALAAVAMRRAAAVLPLRALRLMTPAVVGSR